MRGENIQEEGRVLNDDGDDGVRVNVSGGASTVMFTHRHERNGKKTCETGSYTNLQHIRDHKRIEPERLGKRTCSPSSEGEAAAYAVLGYGILVWAP